MAKKKILIVIGDSDACSGCKGEKAFLSKNEKKLKAHGIDEVKFINPSKGAASEKIAMMYQKKHIGGLKAQPLNVVVSGKDDVAFLGFSKGKFLKEIDKATKVLDKEAKKSGGGGSKKKKGGLFSKFS